MPTSPGNIRRQIVERLLREPGVRDRVLSKLPTSEASGDPRLAGTELLAAAPRDLEQALEKPQLFPWEQHAELEALIRLTGRPVYTVKNDWVTIDGTDGEWRDKFRDAETRLRPAILGVGRVEVGNHPDFQWLGTAFVIDENVVVTNRHVAAEFAAGAAPTWEFRKFMGSTLSSTIDFRREAGATINPDTVFAVKRILHVAGPNEPDIALLEVDWRGHPRAPLTLNGRMQRDLDVAVIGHPAADSRARQVDDIRRVFQGIYDVKRLAPGRIMDTGIEQFVFTHDCSTLGGNSGSAVVDLITGDVVGLHFAGAELKANYAVSVETVVQVRDRVLARTSVMPQFAPPLPPAVSPAELVARNCQLQPYDRLPRPRPFIVSGDCICFASPDSTFAVTRKLFDSASKKLLIGIYDFSAPHMESVVLDAAGRGVAVTLMLDVDSSGESNLLRRLRRRGVRCVEAPSCASKRARYFHSCHEKVIVIDDQWTFVQSGNYSNRSIPANGEPDENIPFRPGNRDCGVVIQSPALAAYFTRVLERDIQLEEAEAPEAVSTPLPEAPEFWIERPARKPAQLFASQSFALEKVSVLPVLTPENYVPTVSALLRSAKKSVYIEQQYIRTGHEVIQDLLESLAAAWEEHPKLDVRIILAPPIGDRTKTQKEFVAMQDLEDYGLKLGKHVRLLDTAYFTHCHNKLIVVDGERVLVGSQNWSRTAVLTNREASLLIESADVAGYFQKLFVSDWDKMSVESFGRERPGRESLAEGVGRGNAIDIDFADIEPV